MDKASLFSECEGAKRNKHVLNGATMVPLVVSTFGKLVPSAQGFLHSFTDVVHRGSWLRIAQQYLSCASVRGRALCSVTILRLWLRVLGKTLVMVLWCHSSECG